MFRRLLKPKLFKVVLLAIVGAIVLAPLFFPVKARAISDPASIAINNLYVFRNLGETGDYLFYCRYDVNYAVTPTEPASSTYEMALYNAAGTVLIASRPLNYYQHNIISLYFSASQAAASGLVWNTAYIIKIRGSPSVFPILTENVNMKTQSLAASSYYEQTDFASRMLAEANVLQTDWGITLLTNGYLNSTGAAYFTYAIPNFSEFAPDAMYSSTYYPTATNNDWSNTTYADSLHLNQGPRLQAAIQNMATWLHVSEDWMAIWLVCIAYLTTAGVAYSVTKDPGVSMMIGIPVIVAAAWLGVGLSWLTILIAAAIIAAILFGIHFILGRFA